MTAEAPKSPRSRRRPPAVAAPTEPAEGATARPRRTRATKPAEPPRTPAPNSRPVVVDPDAMPGEETPGEPVFKLTVSIPQSLHERASGVVANADFTGEPPEVESLTSLVRIALVEKVAAYEHKYNMGMAFPVPHRLRRGRAPKS